ncbi:MAG: hypothetical protein KME20_09740 [Kaiparowitsia implicata GSE-PSE-MK54-09C]|nr:hypothetical protein [Kaiparowitsia implicata GSE-PSE-MK54-09C]
MAVLSITALMLAPPARASEPLLSRGDLAKPQGEQAPTASRQLSKFDAGLWRPDDAARLSDETTPPDAPTMLGGLSPNPIQPAVASSLPDSSSSLQLPDPVAIAREVGGTQRIAQDTTPAEIDAVEDSADFLEPLESSGDADDAVEMADPADPADPLDESAEDLDPVLDESEELLTDEPTGDRWQFSIEPYVFVPLDVQADITALGRSASLRAGLEDILSFDRAFNAGVRLEAQHRRFGVMLDGFYLSVAESGRLPVTFPAGSLLALGIPTEVAGSANASASLRQGTIDLAAFYRVVDASLNDAATVENPYPRLILDPFLGLRVNILRQEIEVDDVQIGPMTVPVNREFSSSRTSLEPLVGARLGLQLSQRWGLAVRSDVSGFDISADRNTTWRLFLAARYGLSPSATLQLAYIFSALNFRDGEGLRRAEVDLDQQGLGLSVSFRF